MCLWNDSFTCISQGNLFLWKQIAIKPLFFLLLWEDTWQNQLKQLSCVMVGGTVHHGQEAAVQTARVAGYLGTCSSKAGTEEWCCSTYFLHLIQSRTPLIEYCHLPKLKPSLKTNLELCFLEDESSHAIQPDWLTTVSSFFFLVINI